MPVNVFTWLWALWIAFFLVVEGVAVFNQRANDTMSSHVWYLIKAQPYFVGVPLMLLLLWLIKYFYTEGPVGDVSRRVAETRERKPAYASFGEPRTHQPVHAHSLLRRADREGTVCFRRHAYQELAAVGTISQWLWDLLAVLSHVCEAVVDDLLDARQSLLGGRRQPAQQREFSAETYVFGVFDGPGDPIGVMVAHFMPFSFSIALTTWRTWYGFALPLAFWMFTRGSPGHGVRYTR